MTERPLRGRGRPPLFDDTKRQQFLDAVTQGMRLGQAADHVGIDRRVPTRHARTDPAFGAALDQARAIGKKVRDEKKDHDESRYNNQGCRCDLCRAAATAARTGRRHTQHEDPDQTPDDPGGQVYDLTQPASSNPRFPLARAS